MNNEKMPKQVLTARMEETRKNRKTMEKMDS
jgi:hypothetical protein